MFCIFIHSVNRWWLFIFSTLLATLWVSVLWAIRIQMILIITVHTEVLAAVKKTHRFTASQWESHTGLLSLERGCIFLTSQFFWVSTELIRSLIYISGTQTTKACAVFLPDETCEKDMSNTIIYLTTHDTICFVHKEALAPSFHSIHLHPAGSYFS